MAWCESEHQSNSVDCCFCSGYGSFEPSFYRLCSARSILAIPFLLHLGNPYSRSLLMIGPKYGLLIGILNTAILQAIFPGHPFIHAIGSLMSGSSMLLGAYFGFKLITRGATQETALQGKKTAVYSTGFGILSRAAVMTPVNYLLLHYAGQLLLPGIELTEPIILAILPLVVLFNATITLYTIPTGFFIAKTITKHLRINIKNDINIKKNKFQETPNPQTNHQWFL